MFIRISSQTTDIILGYNSYTYVLYLIAMLECVVNMTVSQFYTIVWAMLLVFLRKWHCSENTKSSKAVSLNWILKELRVKTFFD